jgi:hypothetical protein
MSPTPNEPAPEQPEPAPGSPGPTGSADGCAQRQLVFVKNNQRYIFRYAPGEETQVLDAVAKMAAAGDGGLDWFDAAVLSHQVGRHISQELDQLLKF